MSTRSGALDAEAVDVSPARLLALAGALGVMLSYLAVLYEVVATVGDPLLFYPVVLAPLVAATILSRFIRVSVALAIGGVLFVGGVMWHMLSVTTSVEVWELVSNNIELLTGQTVLRIEEADIWALTVAPTPVFVTWFLALRRQYVGAAAVSGGMLVYLVLTGDAGTGITLLGVVAAGVLVAFGDVERSDERRMTAWSSGADHATIIVALMVVAPLVITVVPGGAATPVTFVGDGQGTPTMEDNVVGSGNSLDIAGTIELTPEPRYTVQSEQPRYWRTSGYDRYTGDGWVRTGTQTVYANADIEGPPGETEQLTQQIEVLTLVEQLPTAWRPISIDHQVAGDVKVDDGGGFTIARTLRVGEEFEVVSEVPNPSAEELAGAGENYPEEVVETYTQLPASTPDRLRERTEHITQNAENPHETALVVQEWLQMNREYSLDVDRPDGDIADAFLFEMEAGYCTYFATTMVAMLRSEGIPARMAVGYSPGERAGNDRYLVRGLNSHAWVEVYFPEVGWVEFDPTPSVPRRQAEQAAVNQAGSGDSGSGGGSGGGSSDPVSVDELEIEESDPPDTGDLPDVDGAPANSDSLEESLLEQSGPTNPVEASQEEDDGFLVPLPSREQFLLVLIALLGVGAWVRQSTFTGRLFRAFAIRFQRRSDPATDVERAYERLVLILEGRYRPRETGETMRQYLDDVNAGRNARRFVELHERARYGETVSQEDADRAVELVDRVRESAR